MDDAAASTVPLPPTVEDIEIGLLLDGVFRQYGYDFRDYAMSSLRRRVRNLVREEGLATVSGLQERVLHDTGSLQRFLLALSVNVTSMFRDPGFYKLLRDRVVPVLRTYPKVRIWHAGCSTGEEAYSFAIVLEEEGIYDRCQIFATDMNEAVLQKAAAGELPLRGMRENTANYIRSGGRRAFASFYTAVDDRALLHPSLRRNIVFAQHNLVSDRSFNEFNVVLCRNVLIYFNRDLQDRVHRLFYQSLIRFGFLALGAKETVQFSPHQSAYEDLGERIYRKVA
jgi:chemotaxis protein methyltransferase CheR